MAIALSTAWNAHRCKDGYEIISEIRSLGFNEIELGFNLTQQIVNDVEQAVGKKQIKVSSVHNYCPIPDGLRGEEALPDCYSLASCKEEERAQAVRYTKATIDTASRLEAEAVVLHCGRVEIRDYTRDLIGLYNQGQIKRPQAVDLKAKMRIERDTQAGAYLAEVIKSLDELADYAKRLDVKLGIENRFYFREIPSFEEVGQLLSRFKGSNIYYWHDTGHAQLWENLGLTSHEHYLKNYSPYMLGIHLHDISGARDHRAPLKGDFDFSMLKPYIKKDCFLILEAHYPADSKDIISAKEYLERLFLPR